MKTFRLADTWSGKLWKMIPLCLSSGRVVVVAIFRLLNENFLKGNEDAVRDALLVTQVVHHAVDDVMRLEGLTVIFADMPIY